MHCVDVMIMLLRNGIVRNDETHKYMFWKCIYFKVLYNNCLR